MAQRTDRRKTRTRTRLIEAFNRLVLSRRGERIRIADIVAEADVGRSTFYEHYRSAEDIYMAALARPFAILADAAAGEGDAPRLAALLDHFHENRRRARERLVGPAGERAARLLATMVEERLAAEGKVLALPLRLAALELAEAALGPIRGWIAGRAPCPSAALAESICRGGRQLRAALEAGQEEGAAASRTKSSSAS